MSFVVPQTTGPSLDATASDAFVRWRSVWSAGAAVRSSRGGCENMWAGATVRVASGGEPFLRGWQVIVSTDGLHAHGCCWIRGAGRASCSAHQHAGPFGCLALVCPRKAVCRRQARAAGAGATAFRKWLQVGVICRPCGRNARRNCVDPTHCLLKASDAAGMGCGALDRRAQNDERCRVAVEPHARAPSPPQEGEASFAGRMLSLHISHQFRVW